RGGGEAHRPRGGSRDPLRRRHRRRRKRPRHHREHFERDAHRRSPLSAQHPGHAGPARLADRAYRHRLDRCHAGPTTGGGPVTAPTIEDRDDLISYLHAAMALEHATIPPYLTAYYSIHPTTNSDAAHIIRVVAVEEMLHLTLAANVLNAIGGTPDLTRPGFVPSYPVYLPDWEDDFTVDLRSFSPEAVETFCKIERPGKASSADSRLVRTRQRARTVLASSPTVEGMRFFSIGEFYAEIIAGLEHV